MVATLISAHETCDEIVNSVKSSNLHFILQETPHSVYITIRKKFVNEAFAKNDEENNSKQTYISLKSAYENLKNEFDKEIEDHKEAKNLIKTLEKKLESAKSSFGGKSKKSKI